MSRTLKPAIFRLIEESEGPLLWREIEDQIEAVIQELMEEDKIEFTGGGYAVKEP